MNVGMCLNVRNVVNVLPTFVFPQEKQPTTTQWVITMRRHDEVVI